MAPIQYSLAWDAYSSNICSGLSLFQQSGQFVDMTLAADGHYVKVHQLVISLVSPYIKELILSAPCPHPVIFLNNISYPTLCTILEYAYTGEALVATDKLDELLQACKALHIKGLEDLKTNLTDDSIADSCLQHTTDTEDIQLNLSSGQIENSTFMGNSKVESRESKNTLNVHAENTLNEAEKPTTKKSVNLENQMITGLHFTVSCQGSPQIILNRYMYFLIYSSKTLKQRMWRCVDYKRKHKCPAYALLNRENTKVLRRAHAHNHPYHDSKILKKIKNDSIFSNMRDATQDNVKLKNGVPLNTSIIENTTTPFERL